MAQGLTLDELIMMYEIQFPVLQQNENDTTRTRKSVHVTYVTTFGLKRNAYANNVQSQVTLADLFASSSYSPH